MDTSLAPQALERVAQLIIAIAGGTVEAPPVDLYAGDRPRAALALRTARVARVLGVALEASHVATLLASIGCQADVEAGAAIVHVNVPSWRSDLVAEIDLIEEVARLHGYDALPDEIRPFRPGTSADAPMWTLAARLRTALVAEGLLEARPIPFVAGGDEHVRLLNPLAENEAHLRRTLLESLARRAEFNLSHMEGDIRLFEIGSVFERGSGTLPDEHMHVGALVMGARTPAHFTHGRAAALDEWDAKAIAQRVAELVAAGRPVSLEPATTQASSGHESSLPLWTIVIDGVARGAVSRVTLDAPVWAAPAYGVEVDLGRVSNDDIAPPASHAHGSSSARGDGSATAATVGRAKYRPLPTTPATEFDLALLVPPGVQAAQVEQVIREAAGDLLERLLAFDVYEGDGVPEGHRSVAWRLTLRHPERTLRDKEIDGRRSRILTALQTGLNVRQRTT